MRRHGLYDFKGNFHYLDVDHPGIHRAEEPHPEQKIGFRAARRGKIAQVKDIGSAERAQQVHDLSLCIHIVGTIAYNASIPGYVIGKIRIEDKVTYVDVPEDLVEQVLKQNGNYRIGKEKFALSK